jgi:hypothetical protein
VLVWSGQSFDSQTKRFNLKMPIEYEVAFARREFIETGGFFYIALLKTGGVFFPTIMIFAHTKIIIIICISHAVVCMNNNNVVKLDYNSRGEVYRRLLDMAAEDGDKQLERTQATVRKVDRAAIMEVSNIPAMLPAAAATSAPLNEYESTDIHGFSDTTKLLRSAY